MSIYQGIVTKVDGARCTVKFGSQEISDIRLRASMTDNDSHILLTPKVNTPVIVGSLSGDMSDLVVLQVDEVESIVINGGQLGGLIKIEDLTDKLNNLVSEVNSLKDAFNSHTHKVTTKGSPTAQEGDAAPVLSKAQAMSRFNKDDYEDTTITH